MQEDEAAGDAGGNSCCAADAVGLAAQLHQSRPGGVGDGGASTASAAAAGATSAGSGSSSGAGGGGSGSSAATAPPAAVSAASVAATGGFAGAFFGIFFFILGRVVAAGPGAGRDPPPVLVSAAPSDPAHWGGGPGPDPRAVEATLLVATSPAAAYAPAVVYSHNVLMERVGCVP